MEDEKGGASAAGPSRASAGPASGNKLSGGETAGDDLSNVERSTGATFGLEGAALSEKEPNAHLALIYEHREGQFGAVVPFIKKGLEKGEKCLYIADENSEEELLEAFREGGIDVEAALGSGALSIHTKADTYLKGGEFETDEMLEFLRETLTEAKGEEGYAGVRATGEMTWALDEGLNLDCLARYEGLLNTLCSGTDYVILCQYNRDRFPDSFLSEVIQSHPLVVSGDIATENVHYLPPDEFLGGDRPPLDVGRTLRNLLERTRIRQALQDRDRYQRELYKITSAPNCSFDEKLDALFELGCEYFDLEFGGLARVDPDADLFEVERMSGEHSHLVSGRQYPLSETYCQLEETKEGTAAVSDPVGRGFEGKLCYEKFGVRAYLGTWIELEEGHDRTFFFLSCEPREEPFTRAQRTFHHLMGQWVEQELAAQEREERIRKVRGMTSTVTKAEQQERERAARVLHDGLQQRLFGTQLKISSLQKTLRKREQDELAGQAEEIESEIREIIQSIRELSVGMSPPILGSEGLTAALEWLQSHMAETYGLKVELTADREFRVREEMRILLFQTTRELLSNVDEHAGVRRAEVELREAEGELVIEVSDEGRGFTPGEAEAQEESEDIFGLSAARERIRLFGGDLQIHSAPGKGTRAVVRVPLEKGTESASSFLARRNCTAENDKAEEGRAERGGEG